MKTKLLLTLAVLLTALGVGSGNVAAASGCTPSVGATYTSTAAWVKCTNGSYRVRAWFRHNTIPSILTQRDGPTRSSNVYSTVYAPSGYHTEYATRVNIT